MFYQTEPEFPEGVRKEGCYLFTILGMVEKAAKKAFTKSQIVDIYMKSRDAKYVTGNCNVINPDKVCSLASAMLGDNKHTVLQVGSMSPDMKPTFWPWAARDPKYREVSFLALRFKTGKGHDHYILADKCGTIIFDSYNFPYERKELQDALIHNVQPYSDI
jgi:hypothetical protein